MLLDCDTVIDFKEYQSDNYAEAGKKWDTCELRTWLNRNFFNMFTRGEQSAIFTSVKAEPAEKDASFNDLSENILLTPLTGDKVFCLDALEVARPTYGYANTTLKDYTKLKKTAPVKNVHGGCAVRELNQRNTPG